MCFILTTKIFHQTRIFLLPYQKKGCIKLVNFFKKPRAFFFMTITESISFEESDNTRYP
jgi:hypothetical protein